MEIECAFFGPLREAVGQKTVHHETAAGTAGELLAELEETYPDLPALREDGGLTGDVAVTLNGTHLAHRDGLATELADGDVVRLTNPVHGG